MRLEEYEAERAKERMQVRKGDQPGATVEKIPQLETGKARDYAAEAVGTNPRYVSDAKRIRKEAPDVRLTCKRANV